MTITFKTGALDVSYLNNEVESFEVVAYTKGYYIESQL